MSDNSNDADATFTVDFYADQVLVHNESRTTENALEVLRAERLEFLWAPLAAVVAKRSLHEADLQVAAGDARVVDDDVRLAAAADDGDGADEQIAFRNGYYPVRGSSH